MVIVKKLLFWCIVGKALYFLHSMISCHVAAVVVVSSIFKGVLVILGMKSWRVFLSNKRKLTRGNRSYTGALWVILSSQCFSCSGS